MIKAIAPRRGPPAIERQEVAYITAICVSSLVLALSLTPSLPFYNRYVMWISFGLGCALGGAFLYHACQKKQYVEKDLRWKSILEEVTWRINRHEKERKGLSTRGFIANALEVAILGSMIFMGVGGFFLQIPSWTPWAVFGGTIVCGLMMGKLQAKDAQIEHVNRMEKFYLYGLKTCLEKGLRGRHMVSDGDIPFRPKNLKTDNPLARPPFHATTSDLARVMDKYVLADTAETPTRYALFYCGVGLDDEFQVDIIRAKNISDLNLHLALENRVEEIHIDSRDKVEISAFERRQDELESLLKADDLRAICESNIRNEELPLKSRLQWIEYHRIMCIQLKKEYKRENLPQADARAMMERADVEVAKNPLVLMWEGIKERRKVKKLEPHPKTLFKEIEKSVQKEMMDLDEKAITLRKIIHLSQLIISLAAIFLISFCPHNKWVFLGLFGAGLALERVLVQCAKKERKLMQEIYSLKFTEHLLRYSNPLKYVADLPQIKQLKSNPHVDPFDHNMGIMKALGRALSDPFSRKPLSF